MLYRIVTMAKPIFGVILDHSVCGISNDRIFYTTEQKMTIIFQPHLAKRFDSALLKGALINSFIFIELYEC